METALFVVALVTGILLVTAGANRFGFPPPLALVVVGVLVGYLPGVPEVHLEPELVLLGLLPPLLYAEAVQTSLADFRLNRRTILLLSIGLVVFTAAGVAVVAHALLPDLGWPAAFAIGAVVAPPDAVATTAVARRIGMPDRLVTILEGESLLNDATALVALRTAIAAIGATVTVWQVAGDFLLSAGGVLRSASPSTSSWRGSVRGSRIRCSTPPSPSWCRSLPTSAPRRSTRPASWPS